MKIGIFSDTYFPQISGVSTSVKTLRDELIKLGHQVYIFTTTDPNSDDEQDREEQIIRLRSVPAISFTERRIVMVGLATAIKIAGRYDLDIIHTQTEFGVGILGKMVANQLKIPVLHTLHTKYEDYLHYIANGLLIRPSTVKYLIRTFLLGTEGIICPSEMTKQMVLDYGIHLPIRVIPTGIELKSFTEPSISQAESQKLREELSVQEDEIMLLSLGRLSTEKNIQAVIQALPDIISKVPARLVIVGDGPCRKELEKLVSSLELDDVVYFKGEVPNTNVVDYYKAADYFISASTSETQGLTFTEALAAGTPVLACENPYLNHIIDDPQFGSLFLGVEDIASVTVNAIRNRVEPDSEKFEKKLYEISSENFGIKVAEFYEYMIENYIPFSKRATNNMKFMGQRMRGNLSMQSRKLLVSSNSFVAKFFKYVKINKDNKEEDE